MPLNHVGTRLLARPQPASPWFLVVAAPSGSVERYPRQEDLVAFRIPHGVFVKLHKGTWHAGGAAREHGLPSSGQPLEMCVHSVGRAVLPVLTRRRCLGVAGPLFDAETASFYNLELSDTNVVDHNTHDYAKEQGLTFEVAD